MSCSFIIFKLFSLLFSLSYFLVLEIDRLLRDFKGLGIRGDKGEVEYRCVSVCLEGKGCPCMCGAAGYLCVCAQGVYLCVEKRVCVCVCVSVKVRVWLFSSVFVCIVECICL